MEYVTAVIVVTLVLMAIGIVVNELLRLRKWLKNSPAEKAPKPPEQTD